MLKNVFYIIIALMLVFTMHSRAFAKYIYTAQEIQELEAKAEAGDAKAQINMGSMYAQGEGLKQDY